MRTLSNARVDGRRTGYPDNMTESEWTDYCAMRPPAGYDGGQPRPRNVAFPVFQAAVDFREQVYGGDRSVWPQRGRYRELHVRLLDDFDFATLIEAARRCASEADAGIIEAAFKPRGD